MDTELIYIPSRILFDVHEQSSNNTDVDSIELIDVLRGHSIVQRAPISPLSTATSSCVHPIHSYRCQSHVTDDINETMSTASSIDEWTDEPKSSALILVPQVLLKRDDDLTEFDATENLASISDSFLFQPSNDVIQEQQNELDASTTDIDADDDDDDDNDDDDNLFERHDLINRRRPIDELTQTCNAYDMDNEPYQRYDLAMATSSHDDSFETSLTSSLSSCRQRTDDIYLIPGYSGLWRPSTDNECNDTSMNYDADDEQKLDKTTRVG
jgi:hypothetical protein